MPARALAASGVQLSPQPVRFTGQVARIATGVGRDDLEYTLGAV